jgi:membrane-anchored glycerophosphoryl diester phosphodiesterase (GDPDase)
MLIDTIVANPWLVALSWGMLSLFDFSATMVYSKAYRDFLSENIEYEGGMELNPVFEQDVRQLRWFSPRYFILMLLVAFLIAFVGSWMPKPWFELLAGTALLLVFVVDLRHIENLSTVWFMRSDPNGFKGKVEQSYALSQRRVAVATFNIGLLYLVIHFLVGRVFFLGGAVICVLFAVRHFLLARRKLPKPAG